MQKGTKCASKDYLGSKYASKGLLASHALLLTVVSGLKPPQPTDFSRDFDNQHGDPDVMKQKLPRWFLAAAWARVAPCAAAVLASAFSLLALAALVLAPARFVGAGFFSCCGGAVVCCCAAAAAKIWPPKWPRTPHNPILARTSTSRRGMRFLGLFLKCYARPKIAVQVFPVFGVWGG